MRLDRVFGKLRSWNVIRFLVVATITGQVIYLYLSFEPSILALDPAHGGEDLGASFSPGYREKDITLKFALILKSLLEHQHNLLVFMTRDKDIFVPLEQRSKLVNDRGSDFVISIHVNAAPSPIAHGTEVFIPVSDRFSTTSRWSWFKKGEDDVRVAESFLRRIEGARHLGLVSRGVKQAPFWILTQVDCPAIMVEVGFITNFQDQEAMLQYATEFCELLAESIGEMYRAKNIAVTFLPITIFLSCLGLILSFGFVRRSLRDAVLNAFSRRLILLFVFLTTLGTYAVLLFWHNHTRTETNTCQSTEFEFRWLSPTQYPVRGQFFIWARNASRFTTWDVSMNISFDRRHFLHWELPQNSNRLEFRLLPTEEFTQTLNYTLQPARHFGLIVVSDIAVTDTDTAEEQLSEIPPIIVNIATSRLRTFVDRYKDAINVLIGLLGLALVVTDRVFVAKKGHNRVKEKKHT